MVSKEADKAAIEALEDSKAVIAIAKREAEVASAAAQPPVQRKPNYPRWYIHKDPAKAVDDSGTPWYAKRFGKTSMKIVYGNCGEIGCEWIAFHDDQVKSGQWVEVPEQHALAWAETMPAATEVKHKYPKWYIYKYPAIGKGNAWYAIRLTESTVRINYSNNEVQFSKWWDEHDQYVAEGLWVEVDEQKALAHVGTTTSPTKDGPSVAGVPADRRVPGRMWVTHRVSSASEAYGSWPVRFSFGDGDADACGLPGWHEIVVGDGGRLEVVVKEGGK